MNEQIKKGYKQTEIGIIPQDWEVDKLGNIAKITTGSKNTQDKVDGGNYPFFVRSQTIERINSFSFDGEAVLTAGDGVGTGKVFHYINGKFDYHQRVYKISNFSERLNGYFFFKYFSTNFYNRIIQMTAKSSVDSVRKNMISEMLIPIPSTKGEQVAIATALSDMDSLIQNLEKLINKKRNIKQGAMQELLTGRKRLSGFDKVKTYKQTNIGPIPEDWEVVTLKSISQITSGKRLPKGSKLSKTETTHPYIRVSDMFMGGINSKNILFVPDDIFPYIKNYRIFSEDIFISVAGTLGIIGKIPKNLSGANLTENADKITNITCCRDYLLYVLISSVIQNKIEAEKTLGAQPKLALTRIRNLQLPLPPTKDEQVAIAAVLSDMDEEIERLEKQLDKYKKIKTGMMQELLTGKKRLI